MMAARQSSSSSEEILSDESELNEINLYDSDAVESLEPSANVGPRPYRFQRFEPHQVRRNVPEEEGTSGKEHSESETNRLGNTDW